MNKDPRDGALVLSLAKTHVFQGTPHATVGMRSTFIPDPLRCGAVRCRALDTYVRHRRGEPRGVLRHFRRVHTGTQCNNAMQGNVQRRTPCERGFIYVYVPSSSGLKVRSRRKRCIALWRRTASRGAARHVATFSPHNATLYAAIYHIMFLYVNVFTRRKTTCGIATQRCTVNVSLVCLPSFFVKRSNF